MGTWAAPQTTDAAKQLKKLMKHPIKAEGGSNILWHLIGDDEFWDVVDAVKVLEPNADIRPLIGWRIGDWVGQIDAGYSGWKKPWDKEAMVICRDLSAKHYDFLEVKRMHSMLTKAILKRAADNIEDERHLEGCRRG